MAHAASGTRTGDDDDDSFLSVSAPASVRVLTYNVFVRPPGVSGPWPVGDAKDARINFFLENFVHNFDVVIFQEMFEWGSGRVNNLLQRVRKLGFFYHVRPGPAPITRPFKCIDSGVCIISRYPIVEMDYSLFEASRNDDVLASKGVTYAKVLISPPTKEHPQGVFINIFGVHMQNADYPTQIHQLKEFGEFMKRCIFNKSTDSGSYLNFLRHYDDNMVECKGPPAYVPPRRSSVTGQSEGGGGGGMDYSASPHAAASARPFKCENNRFPVLVCGDFNMNSFDSEWSIMDESRGPPEEQYGHILNMFYTFLPDYRVHDVCLDKYKKAVISNGHGHCCVKVDSTYVPPDDDYPQQVDYMFLLQPESRSTASDLLRANEDMTSMSTFQVDPHAVFVPFTPYYPTGPTDVEAGNMKKRIFASGTSSDLTSPVANSALFTQASDHYGLEATLEIARPFELALPESARINVNGLAWLPDETTNTYTLWLRQLYPPNHGFFKLRENKCYAFFWQYKVFVVLALLIALTVMLMFFFYSTAAALLSSRSYALPSARVESAWVFSVVPTLLWGLLWLLLAQLGWL